MELLRSSGKVFKCTKRSLDFHLLLPAPFPTHREPKPKPECIKLGTKSKEVQGIGV